MSFSEELQSEAIRYADAAAKPNNSAEEIQANATLSLAKSAVVITEELMRIRRRLDEESN